MEWLGQNAQPVMAAIALLAVVVNVFIYLAARSQASGAKKQAEEARKHRTAAEKSMEAAQRSAASLGAVAASLEGLAEAEQQKRLGDLRREVMNMISTNARLVYAPSSDPTSHQAAQCYSYLSVMHALPEPERSLAVRMWAPLIADAFYGMDLEKAGVGASAQAFIKECKGFARRQDSVGDGVASV